MLLMLTLLVIAIQLQYSIVVTENEKCSSLERTQCLKKKKEKIIQKINLS